MPMPEDLGGLPELQREVQRQIGRCLLRLQQYERLMKAMLASHEHAGTADTIEANRAAQVERYAGLTLGSLAGAFFETLLVPDGFERDILPADKVPMDRPSVAHVRRISMSADRWNETKDAVRELVTLRNELVHHFLDRFDLWSEEGCIQAQQHLTDAYGRIDGHLNELSGWAKDMERARQYFASVDASEAFGELMDSLFAQLDGVDWTQAGIVKHLEEAFHCLAVDGWAPLEAARQRVMAADPEHEPGRYGCRSWQQVLHESKAFELVYRRDDEGRRVAWFQPRGTACR